MKPKLIRSDGNHDTELRLTALMRAHGIIHLRQAYGATSGMAAGSGDRRTEGGGRKPEDGGQRTEGRGQRSGQAHRTVRGTAGFCVSTTEVCRRPCFARGFRRRSSSYGGQVAGQATSLRGARRARAGTPGQNSRKPRPTSIGSGRRTAWGKKQTLPPPVRPATFFSCPRSRLHHSRSIVLPFPWAGCRTRTARWITGFRSRRRDGSPRSNSCAVRPTLRPTLHKDFTDFLRLLNEREVRYLVVGGYLNASRRGRNGRKDRSCLTGSSFDGE